jgi:hypothetical protein
MRPAVAIDSGDGVHIVWQDDTSGIAEICYKRSLDGGATWSTNKILTWNSGASEYPAIAADSYDYIHVVWQDDTPGNLEIYYVKSEDRGATWSVPRRLTWTSGSGEHPAIAVDSSDRIHIAWQDDKTGVAEVYYRQSTDGGTNWSAVTRLTWTSGVSGYPDMAAGSGSSVFLVWHDDTPGHQEVYFKRSTDGGATWEVATRLTWTSGDCWMPAIARGSGNALHVVYCSEYNIFTKKSTNAGTNWNTAKQLTWSPNLNVKSVVAVDSLGTIHMIWQKDYVHDEADIFYRRSTDGGTTWSYAVDLTGQQVMNGRSYGPAIAIDSTNTVYFVWYDEAWIWNFEIFYKKST